MNRSVFLATVLVGAFAFALAMCVEPSQRAASPESMVQGVSEQIGPANSLEAEEKSANDILEKYFANLESRYEFSAAEGATMQTIAGDYYQGDGLGFNIRLQLSPGGQYHATSHGCTGPEANASGTWKVTESKLQLTPHSETDELVGRLRELHILAGKKEAILVHDEDMRFLRHFGEHRDTCLRRVSGRIESN